MFLDTSFSRLNHTAHLCLWWPGCRFDPGAVCEDSRGVQSSHGQCC